MLRKRCLFLLNIYNNFCKKVLNICYLASLNKIRFLLYLFGDILTSNTNPRLGSCQGSYFLTHQSKMSMLLKTAYRPRAVVQLVSIINCLAYDWTVIDESKLTWHDPKRDVVKWFSNLRFWAYLMKVILQMRRVH
jgi:hypothetical protein